MPSALFVALLKHIKPRACILQTHSNVQVRVLGGKSRGEGSHLMFWEREGEREVYSKLCFSFFLFFLLSIKLRSHNTSQNSAQTPKDKPVVLL